jgi:hypothetical protein
MDTICKFLHSIMFTLTIQISKLTKAVALNSFPHGRFWQFVYKENVSCTRYNIMCQWLSTGRWFFLGTPISSTNKNRTSRYNWNIVESDIKHPTRTLPVTRRLAGVAVRGTGSVTHHPVYIHALFSSSREAPEAIADKCIYLSGFLSFFALHPLVFLL